MTSPLPSTAIGFFKTHRRVVAMDSRDHGRSSDSDGPITYEKMTDDPAALIDHLALGPVDVVSWSDGGSPRRSPK
jgi:pimeloyl-ACP methyl ester carboxylesterase